MFNKKSKSNKKVVLTAVMLSASFLALTVFASNELTNVQLEVNDTPVNYSYTGDITVGELLSELKLDLKEGSASLIEPEKKMLGNDAAIKKSNKVTIVDDGSTFEIYTTAATVGELMEEGTITINEEVDFMNVTSSNKIENDLIIEITRVTREVFTTKSAIPYETVKKEISSLPKGHVKVVSEGSEGILTTETEIIYHNGKEVDRIESSTQSVKPINRVVHYGTGSSAAGSQLGAKLENISYSQKLVCDATAYCACTSCCGWSTGITASGMKAQYGAVAVDPKVIPLGTKLYIESTDGSFIYGYSVAADTGGAIKGNKVDLFFPSHSEALSFGRRNVNVYILN